MAYPSPPCLKALAALFRPLPLKFDRLIRFSLRSAPGHPAPLPSQVGKNCLVTAITLPLGREKKSWNGIEVIPEWYFSSKGKGLPMIQASEFLKLSRDEKRNHPKETILTLLGGNAEALAAAYEVGKWVWVQFEKKPSGDVLEFLKGLGFHWNKIRKAWQHPCGVFCRRSEDDPTEKYEVRKVG